MKKKVRCGAALVLALVMLFGILSVTGCGKESGAVLNVYNYGEYIADGSEDFIDTLQEFKDWYKETYGEKVTVNYTTYSTCEDMYSKISSGSVSYDLCCPSDYMVARMIAEDMLLEIDFNNVPNYQYIHENFKNLYYDPENKYSIPYTYGKDGVIYDANVVDEEDVGGWDLLWNEKYSGQILQFNNPRDAFGTAMFYLGNDFNSTDKGVWDQALEAMRTQKPLVKSYVQDEIFNMMEVGEAAVAPFYSGDYYVMKVDEAENVDLQCYFPEDTNYFIDAFVIPKCCQHKELAEIFLNFMFSKEIASGNAEFIGYSSPSSLVYENPDYIAFMEDYYEADDIMDILYGDIDDFAEKYNKYAFRNMDNDMLAYQNSLWEALKIG